MEINLSYTEQVPIKLKTFLRNNGISRHLMSFIRNNNGSIIINGNKSFFVDKILPGTNVVIVLPPEKNRKKDLIPSYVPIDILYEDRNIMIINKSAHLLSIPSRKQYKDSLINRIYGYYKLRGYDQIIPHIVTRLDRDTTGIVLLAKHRYAHALLTQKCNYKIKKIYYAILSNRFPYNHLLISEPIGRDYNSIIKRKVSLNGKTSKTEIWICKRFKNNTLCKIQLHTGRTHQIRVHCSYLGYPLVGDTLYGGEICMPLQRQALHCGYLEFYNPFKHCVMSFSTPLPSDMQEFIINNE